MRVPSLISHFLVRASVFVPSKMMSASAGAGVVVMDVASTLTGVGRVVSWTS